MKTSYHNAVKSALFDFAVISALIFISETGLFITPKKLRPMNDPRIMFFIAFIVYLLWLIFSDITASMAEYCIKHPTELRKARVTDVGKYKTHKCFRFRDCTYLIIDGLTGVYKYYGAFDFDIEHNLYRISFLPRTHLICGMEPSEEAQ